MPDLNKLSIENFVSPHPLSVCQGSSLQNVHQAMKKHSISHILLSDDSWKPAGVLTDRNVRSFYLSPDFANIRAQEIMTTDFLTFSPTAMLNQVVAKMSEEKTCSAIILDESREFVGIFTATDAIHALHHIFTNYSQLANSLKNSLQEPQ